MKLKLNRAYTTISLYVLLVIAFALILGTICFNIDVVLGWAGMVIENVLCVFFGLFFTFCFLPLVRFFEKRVFSHIFERKKSHPIVVSLLSTLLVDILFVGIVAITVVGIVPAFVDGYNAFRDSVTPTINAWTQRIRESDSEILIRVYNFIYAFFVDLLNPDQGSLILTITTYASILFSRIYDLGVGLVLATYFLVCRRYLLTLTNKLFTAFLPNHFRISTFAVVKRIYNFFMEFFSFKLVSGILLGLLTYLLCIPFKIPYGVVFAVIVFVSVFVPVFGPIVATLGSALIVAVFSPSPARLWQALTILIILAGINIFSALLIEPVFLRKKLRPGPGTVITTIIICYAIFGIGGIFFAIPIYTSVDVIFRELQARMLARKNLPLSNSYYLALDELPPPEKTPAEPGMMADDGSTVVEAPPETHNQGESEDARRKKARKSRKKS